jgi:pimeloyl-ACP methyl ester carboxylesterase
MFNPRLPHFLPRVEAPALIVWGRQDRIVPVECGEQYRRLMPRAALQVLEDCGHLPPIEKPDEFSRAVIEFLRSPARAVRRGPSRARGKAREATA